MNETAFAFRAERLVGKKAMLNKSLLQGDLLSYSVSWALVIFLFHDINLKNKKSKQINKQKGKEKCFPTHFPVAKGKSEPLNWLVIKINVS